MLYIDLMLLTCKGLDFSGVKSYLISFFTILQSSPVALYNDQHFFWSHD